MEILVIDGQGGGMGRGLVAEVKKHFPEATVRAVGTNSVATGNMRKAGADISATGENAVVVGARHADYILGPIGIVIADALYGEITPAMALAVGQSSAKRILLPVNHCDNMVAGVQDMPMGQMIQTAIQMIAPPVTVPAQEVREAQ